MPVGRVTRGTTGVNRLRRIDRYLAVLPVLRRAPEPLVVDLGYGARPWTTYELATRLRRVRPEVEVLGLEIDPARIVPSTVPGVSFALGGFEVPAPRRPVLVRAMNVLRQYEEGEVRAAWARVAARLAPGGLLVDGTCDEIGRVASWIDVGVDGPLRFTMSLRLADLESPSVVAERLPKALIHRNVPGERIHDLLAALDDGWRRAAGYAAYGGPQRFEAAARMVAEAGWPVRTPARRLRLGELTVDWAAVAPS